MKGQSSIFIDEDNLTISVQEVGEDSNEPEDYSRSLDIIKDLFLRFRILPVTGDLLEPCSGNYMRITDRIFEKNEIILTIDRDLQNDLYRLNEFLNRECPPQ